MKTLISAMALILLTGCVGIYGPGKEEIPVCSKPNCYMKFKFNGGITSSSSELPASNGFIKLETSNTSKSETAARMGAPDTKIVIEQGKEVWLYKNRKSLHMYLVAALVIPIPIPFPYYDYYHYVLKFNGDTLEYFGYEKDKLNPIGFCYILVLGKC
jgi:hypothetical protein